MAEAWSGDGVGALSDEEIREAVRRRLKPGLSAATAKIAALHRSRCTVVHLSEHRREEERAVDGPPPKVVLGLKVYDDLDTAQVPAPRSVDDTSTTRLLLRESLRETPCVCGGSGRAQCTTCEGATTVDCPPRLGCKECGGTADACDACDGKGRVRKGRFVPEDAPPEGPASLARVKCAKCRQPGAACPGCRGLGDIPCTRCDATGRAPCPECEGKGSITCARCKGKGSRSTWTEGRVERERVEKVAELPERHAPGRARWTINRHALWSRTVLVEAGDPLPHLLEPGHRPELDRFRTAQRPGAGRTELLRTVRVEQLPLYHVRVAEAPNQEFYVFPSRDGVRVAVAMTTQRAQLITGAAVVAVLLVLAVLLLVVR
ncbi:hypothetical protein ACFYVL_05895 [Streptomyces sp. NPDC004111]|uniref:hypothetical protein n=1 Tax=Streptomyces sp. NPDC004111 TaxID=3364690 RepID=UPI0036786340